MRIKAQVSLGHYLTTFAFQKNIYILCPCSVVMPPVYKENLSEYNNKNEGKKKGTTQLIHLDTKTQGKTKIKTSLSK